MIDLHCHLLPGVDDGARDLEETRSALGHLTDQGVTGMVLTPHLSGALTRRPEALAERLESLDAAWERTRKLTGAEFAAVQIERGTELMLDTPDPDLSDERIRMACTDFVLLELPFMEVPPNTIAVLGRIRESGLRPVVAHPERYGNLTRAMASAWRAAGCLLQVNSGSLTGVYGRGPEKRAWRLLELGVVDYLASDHHSRGLPHLQPGREMLEKRGGAEAAELLLEINPRRLLHGEAPRPVPPLAARRRLWSSAW